MTAPLHPARWPVRQHLRPKDGWKLCTEADVRPELLARTRTSWTSSTPSRCGSARASPASVCGLPMRWPCRWR